MSNPSNFPNVPTFGTPDWQRRTAQAVNLLLNRRIVTSVNGLTGALTIAGGGAASQITAVATTSIGAGMPVIISRSTGKFVLADASSKPLSFVAGLLTAAIAAGFSGTAERQTISLADWSAVIGSTALSQGQPYYLAVGGGMTTTPPSSPNCLAFIGEALSATTLLVGTQPPVQL